MNFEPLGVGGVELIAWRRSARSHVRYHGAYVVRPLLRQAKLAKKYNKYCSETHALKVSTTAIKLQRTARIGIGHEWS